MPNHFHFVLHVNKEGCENIILKDKETHLQVLSKTIGKTLSSYTVAINLAQQRTGNLFQKKTKAKLLDAVPLKGSYMINCIHYVHHNPFVAGLVAEAKEWEFSSLRDYAGLRNGTLCNRQLLYQLTGLDESSFKECKPVGDEEVKLLL